MQCPSLCTVKHAGECLYGTPRPGSFRCGSILLHLRVQIPRGAFPILTTALAQPGQSNKAESESIGSMTCSAFASSLRVFLEQPL